MNDLTEPPFTVRDHIVAVGAAGVVSIVILALSGMWSFSFAFLYSSGPFYLLLFAILFLFLPALAVGLVLRVILRGCREKRGKADRLGGDLITIALTLSAPVLILYLFPISKGEWERPDASPDGRYEVRYYSTYDFTDFFILARWGDHTPGYVSLHDRKTGKRLQEEHVSDLEGQEARWFEDTVFVGNFAWKLPL